MPYKIFVWLSRRYSKNNLKKNHFNILRKLLPVIFSSIFSRTIVLCLIVYSTSRAQQQIDSLDFIQIAPSKNTLATGFSKQLNIYNFNTYFQFHKNFNPILLDISENFNSTFIKSDQNSTRDEHFFTASSNYFILPDFSFGLLLNNNIFSDSRQIDISQASSSSVTAFSQINPTKMVYIVPFGGYTSNKQIGEINNGFVYGGEGFLNNYVFSETKISAQLKFKNEDISPRKNTLRYIDFSALSNLNENVFNSISYQYMENRKDFYFQADSITSAQFDIVNNIQSRIETDNIFQDQFNVNKFLDIFSQMLTGTVTWRTIDRNTRYRSTSQPSSSIFDTKVNEMQLGLESITSYNYGKFFGKIRLSYSERDENHIVKNFFGINPIFYQERVDIESRNNNIAKRISLSILGNYNISESDNIFISFLQNKLRYDTPSPENYDDRDELLSIFRIKYIKTLTPFFDAFINLEGTLNHIVYIFSESSSNNNINRIIKLESGGNYDGKYFSSANSFSVMANYTVYDFEDINPNFRSFSFRQFSANDSSKLIIGDNLNFLINGYIKLSEQGDLKWASFSTHPTRYLEEIYLEPKFVNFYNNFSISFGARYFSLSTFDYQGTQKVLNSRYISFGPLTEFSFYLNNRLNILLSGWFGFIKVTNLADSQQANLNFKMNWLF